MIVRTSVVMVLDTNRLTKFANGIIKHYQDGPEALREYFEDNKVALLLYPEKYDVAFLMELFFGGGLYERISTPLVTVDGSTCTVHISSQGTRLGPAIPLAIAHLFDGMFKYTTPYVFCNSWHQVGQLYTFSYWHGSEDKIAASHLTFTDAQTPDELINRIVTSDQSEAYKIFGQEQESEMFSDFEL